MTIDKMTKTGSQLNHRRAHGTDSYGRVKDNGFDVFCNLLEGRELIEGG